MATSLKELLEKHSFNGTIISILSNYKYRLVLENWLSAINKLGIKNYLVISLDEQILEYLNTRNIQTYYHKTGERIEDVFLTKIYILKSILELNYNFIHSDADAIWLKNPLNDYFYMQSNDMVFTQGTIWPPHVHQTWGFVLCTGLFFVRSNGNTKIFLKDVYESFCNEKVNYKKCDQWHFNHIIERDGIEWDIDGSYELTFQNKKFICFNKIINGTTSKYTIALLPHALFQRVNEEKSPVFVKHLFSEKTSVGVMDVLKQNKIFFINENISTK